MEEITCKNCGKKFEVPPYRKDTAKFCSKQCKYQFGWTTLTCKGCGKEFEVRKSRVKSGKHHKYCSHKCYLKHMRKENSPNWNGGISHSSGGYRLLRRPNHPNATQRGYVREHRLVAEEKLDRYLKPEESIHHINGDKKDNRLKNLYLFENEQKHRKHHNQDNPPELASNLVD